MEATKKKRAYLKPEMSRFEMKTQEFIAGSKTDVEVIIPPKPDGPTEVDLEGLIPEECTSNSVVKNLNIGECDVYGANTFNKEGKCPLWDLIEAKGMSLTKTDILYIKRTGTNSYRVSKNDICNP